MRRNGFTMVELIFVIVIIGILAATALPKFSGVKDNAKANSEISAMSSLDGTIVAQLEFRLQDYNDNNVTWHSQSITPATNANKAIQYASVNDESGVLDSILKKNENFKIAGVYGYNPLTGQMYNSALASPSLDVLLLKGPASDVTNGVSYDTSAPNSDISGKPDKNDYWVFNPTSSDMNITNGATADPIIIPARSVGLYDVTGTAIVAAGTIQVKAVDSTPANVNFQVVSY